MLKNLVSFNRKYYNYLNIKSDSELMPDPYLVLLSV